MTGRATALALVLAAATGCEDDDVSPASPAAVEARVDTAFVALLTDLHLADAQATLHPDSLRQLVVADSLQAAVLRRHGLGPDALDARLDALAADPALARATYNAVEARLGDGRQRLTF